MSHYALRRLVPAITIAIAGMPTAAQASPPSANYGLAWYENFDGSAVDTSRWNYRTDTKSFPGITSTQVAANAVVENNQLRLLMTYNAATQRYNGGGLVSKQAFGYGYFEAQIRNTTNTGWHNSFWMMAGDGTDTFAAGRYLEMDSMEADTGNQTAFHSGIHRWNGTAGANSEINNYNCPSGPPAVNLTAGYHTFGVDWREDGIDFYFDGTKYCTAQYPAATYRQDPVNIWLTAVAYSTPISINGTPQYFDTIRFYKKDQYIMNGRYGYSESGAGWQNSTLTGFGLLPQRFSCTAGAKSTYAPGFNQGGSYHVFIWKTANANADTQALVEIHTASGTTPKTIDFTAGPSGWVDLGTYTFAMGESNPAYSVTNTVQSGCQRAGAVKFVRV